MGVPRSVNVTTRGIVAAAATLAATLTALGVLHSTWLLPAILHEARQETKRMIEEHSRFPHAVSVSREEFRMILDRLDRIERKLDRP